MSSGILKIFYAKWLVKLHDDLWICCCSVAKSCLTLSDPVNCSTPGFPALHYLPEFAQTHVHWVSDAIQSAHPPSPSCPSALNLSQHQGRLCAILFNCQWSNHQREVTQGKSDLGHILIFVREHFPMTLFHLPPPTALRNVSASPVFLHLLWQRGIQVTPETKDPISKEDHVHGFQDKN